MRPRDAIRRFIAYAVKAISPPSDRTDSWAWVAWTLRLVLILVHVLFVAPIFIRPNIPLLFPSFSAFDNGLPFIWWGHAGLLAALLLWLLPPRFPLGLISTAYSAFYLYLIGAMFQEGAGLIPGTSVYRGLGVLSGVLFMRALWLWAERSPWFRRRVMKAGPHGR